VVVIGGVKKRDLSGTYNCMIRQNKNEVDDARRRPVALFLWMVG
jgi:hypothetical protein